MTSKDVALLNSENLVVNDATLSLDVCSTQNLPMSQAMSNSQSAGHVQSIFDKVMKYQTMGQMALRAFYTDQYVEGNTIDGRQEIATSRTITDADHMLSDDIPADIPAATRSTDVWVSQNRLNTAVLVNTSKMLTADAHDVLNHYWIAHLKLDKFNKSLAHPAGSLITPEDMEALPDHVYGVCVGEVRDDVPMYQNYQRQMQHAILKSKKEISITEARDIFATVAGIKFTLGLNGSDAPRVTDRELSYWSVDNIAGCTDWKAYMDRSMFPVQRKHIVSTQGAEKWEERLFDNLKPWNVKRMEIPIVPGLSAQNAAKINEYASALIDKQRREKVEKWDEDNQSIGMSQVSREEILDDLYNISDNFVAEIDKRLP